MHGRQFSGCVQAYRRLPGRLWGFVGRQNARWMRICRFRPDNMLLNRKSCETDIKAAITDRTDRSSASFDWQRIEWIKRKSSANK